MACKYLPIEFMYFMLILLFGEVMLQGMVPRNDWVDPSDMFHYDSSSKSMVKNSLDSDSSSNVQIITRKEMQRCSCEKHYYLETRDELVTKNYYKQDQADSKKSADDEMLFMKRHIKQLMNKFPYVSISGEDQHYHLHIKLSYEQREQLENFSKGDVNIHNVDYILSEIFHAAYPITDDGDPLLFFATSEKCQMLGISLSVFAFIFLLIKLPFIRVLIILFVISTGWRWKHMYQEVLAIRSGEIIKFEGLPKSCNPSQWNWYDSIRYWFKTEMWAQEDECVKYHKLLLVDPFWDVSPSLAFSDTVTSFILLPIEKLGSTMGIFFRELYKNCPPFMFWLVAPLATLVPILMIILSYGSQISFFGFSIKPQTRSSVEPAAAPQPPSSLESKKHGRKLIEDIPVENREAIEEIHSENQEEAEEIHRKSKGANDLHERTKEKLPVDKKRKEQVK